MVVKFAVLAICFLSVCYGANILAIMPTPSYSHQIAFRRLWKELSLRGHKVTVITTDPVKDPKLVNLTEIDMKSSYKFFHNISKISETMSMWNMWDGIGDMMSSIAEAQISSAPVQDLMTRRRHFDVVLIEYIFPEFLGFAQLYGCPKILIGSFDVISFYHHALGNPSHPILNPEMGSPFHGTLNFRERLISVLFSLLMSYNLSNKIFAKRQHILLEYFNITQKLEEIVYDVDMLFLNVNPVIQGVRAIGPATINIGDFRPPASSKPLPTDLKEFLDSATNGFIYFSLGSNVKSKEIHEESRRAIIDTLRELPYKVLWKFEADELPGKPQNVKLVKWAPQQDVLAHPNIKLFVTQGGLQSMEEGIYSEVPFVVIPFFGDQDQNARLMQNKGIAKIVNRKPKIEKEELKNAILEVINDPSYRNSVKRLKQLALDTPMSGLDRAIWWTEYVIRNKGAKHLRNPAADLPLYQYYLLDVIGFLVSVAAVTLFVIFKLLKFCKAIISRWMKESIFKKKKLQ